MLFPRRVAFTGSGMASAAVLLPSAFPHAESLVDGVLTVKVTNVTSGTARCQLSVHDVSEAGRLDLRVAAVNALLDIDSEANELDNTRAEAAEGALKILWTDHPIDRDGSSTTSWDSGRTDTSYAIYQECSTPDPMLGSAINGRAQVYTVTGAGKRRAVPDRSGPSVGSVESLLGGLGDLLAVRSRVDARRRHDPPLREDRSITRRT